MTRPECLDYEKKVESLYNSCLFAEKAGSKT